MTERTNEQGRVGRRAIARPTTWLASSLWIAIVLLGASSLDLSQGYWFRYVLTHPFRSPEDLGDVLTSGILVFAVSAYATVGAVVAALRPKNGVGWLCLFFGLIAILLNWQPEDVALMGLASWLSSLAWYLTAPPLAVTLLLLIYPEGRLPSGRWWAVVAMAVVGGPLSAFLEPLRYQSGAAFAQRAAFCVSLGALLASVVALVLRWQRSWGRERQQIKLLVYAVAVTIASIIVAAASSYVLNDIPGAESYPSVLALAAGFGGIALGIPLAIGVAMLMYNLYDIDLLINRTLVYGALTAILAGVYFGGVTATQAVLQASTSTGQEEPPQLLIVASTLAIAALFSPLRRRVQSFIDRRFYRRKYDATKTLAAFNARLRDATDLDVLSDDLVGVVRGTVQPEHASFWLRPESASRGRQTD